MDFLKDVLGEEFDSFVEKLENFNRENPDRAVKICNLSEGKFVSKARFSDCEAERKMLKEKVKGLERDGVFSAKEELEKEKFLRALDVAILKSGAKNETAVRALIDMEALSFSDGEIHGLSEQVNAIRGESPYLFRGGDVSTGMMHGGFSGERDVFFEAARKSALL